ncbi:VacB/RNase II family 3'-5' exoribonuclease [candidate division WOR-3 bacterium]|nr:VacB/RNase II family 3'-5' exoribonuclease [candidate division WOR-3 bacterium]
MNKEIQCIFDALKNSPTAYLNIKILKKKCGKHIKPLLKKLEKEGKIISKGKKFALPANVGYIRGIFDGKREGYGFLMPSSGMKDLFIPPNDTFTALNGDLVLAKITRRSKGRLKARIEEVIERSREYFVGKVILFEGRLMFQPQDKNIPHYFELEDSHKVKEGDFILAEFVKWSTPVLPPLAKFSKKISEDNLYNILVKQEYNLKHRFSNKALAEVKNFSPPSLKGRKNLTSLMTFTIDPSDAKDIDDAISVGKDVKFFHLWVHIADVSGAVGRNSAIDEEAKRRGCTTYLPNETYFMLPKEITKSLSLEEKKESPAVTVYIKFDRRGNILGKEFCKSKIKSDKKFSYTEVQEILDGKVSSPFKSQLLVASELAKILSEKRRNEGYLDFFREEVKVEIKDFRPTAIYPVRELWAHRIIEQFMLAANESVARELESKKIPGIYRIHEEPERNELEQFKILVEGLGFKLPSIKRKDLSFFLDEVKNSTYRRILNYELLRCMKKARYIAKPEPHYGLGSKIYTHFTSPIRRYPDIIVHRLLFGENYAREELKSIADHSTEQEWKSDSAEKEITKFFIMRYLEENTNKEFRGMVTNIGTDGIWVELDDFLVTGFVPIRILPNDDYKIRDRSLSGRYNKFFIGDLLICNIYTVSPGTGELILEYAGKIEKRK